MQENTALISQFNTCPTFKKQTFKQPLYFKYKLLELKENVSPCNCKGF